MTDTSDDVLRDLLLARGVGRGFVDALVDLAQRAEWVTQTAMLRGEKGDVIEAIYEASGVAERKLEMWSREHTPKRPPRPLPSAADLNAVFRDVWGGGVNRVWVAALPEYRITPSDIAPGWLSRMQQPNPSDDEPR